MIIVTIGIDLAKNVFAAHGVDATGRPYLCAPVCLARSCSNSSSRRAVPDWRGGLLRRALKKSYKSITYLVFLERLHSMQQEPARRLILGSA